MKPRYRIFKYVLSITDRQEIEMPEGAQLLTAAAQGENLCVWAIVPETTKKSKVVIDIIGTGNPFPDESRRHLGTAVMPPFVWHVFHNLNPS